jgi:hypothetical protein
MLRLASGKIQVAFSCVRVPALLHQSLGSEEQRRSGLRMIGILPEKTRELLGCQLPPTTGVMADGDSVGIFGRFGCRRGRRLGRN